MMTIGIESNNPRRMKKSIARAFGVSSKGDRLMLEGINEIFYVDVFYGEEEKTLQEALNQIAREYFKWRMEEYYIIRNDMIIAKEMDDIYGERIRKALHKLQALHHNHHLQEMSTLGDSQGNR